VDDEEAIEMLRRRYLQFLIDIDVLPPLCPPKDKRSDKWIGIALCAPLYSYGLYKLFGG